MTIAAEAEAGLQAGPGTNLLAELTASVSMLTTEVRQLREDRRQERLDTATRVIKHSQAFTIGAGGTAIVGLGGPKTGYVWGVKRITVTDSAAVGTAVAGTAYVFAGAIVGTVNTSLMVPENLEWIITPLPNVATFGGRYDKDGDPPDFPVAYGEHVYVYVTGATASQVLKASITYGLKQPIPRRR